MLQFIMNEKITIPQYYVVVEDEIFAFSSYTDAKNCYELAKSEYREPFCTRDFEFAKLIRDGNIASDFLNRRGVTL